MDGKKEGGEREREMGRKRKREREERERERKRERERLKIPSYMYKCRHFLVNFLNQTTPILRIQID